MAFIAPDRLLTSGSEFLPVHKDVIMLMMRESYKSSKQALAWFFRKSRDGWREKALGLRQEIKVLKVRVADVSKARDSWRGRQEEAERQLKAAEQRTRELEAELEQLRAEQTTTARPLAAPAAKKSRDGPWFGIRSVNRASQRGPVCRVGHQTVDRSGGPGGRFTVGRATDFGHRGRGLGPGACPAGLCDGAELDFTAGAGQLAPSPGTGG